MVTEDFKAFVMDIKSLQVYYSVINSVAVNKSLRSVFVIRLFYDETVQQKPVRERRQKRARVELLSQHFSTVMANNTWNVAATCKDTIATGHLPTLAGSYVYRSLLHLIRKM